MEKTYEDGIRKGEANLRSYKDLVKQQIKVLENNDDTIKRLRSLVVAKQEDLEQHIESLSIEELTEILFDKIRKLEADKYNCDECDCY